MHLIFDIAHFHMVWTMSVFTPPAPDNLADCFQDFGSLFPLLEDIRLSLCLFCLLLVRKDR